MRNRQQLIFQGSMIGREQIAGLEFNPAYYWSGCLICGEVYQTEEDRNPPDIGDPNAGAYFFEQKNRHMAWRGKENKRHPARVHRELLLSGNFCTPEAAIKLAPLGLFSLTDLIASDEVAAALGEAPRSPVSDAQTPKAREM